MSIQRILVYFLAYLIAVTALIAVITYDDACAAIPSPQTVNPNQWLTMSASEGVMAWKIYTGDSGEFSKASYRATLWTGNNQPTSMHCSIIDACGKEIHLFATAMRVKIGKDCQHFMVMQSSPAYMLWRTF